MISISDAIEILIFLGLLVGVWSKLEIKTARLDERIRGNEKYRIEDKDHFNNTSTDLKNSIERGFEKVFEKFEHFENKLNNKQDK